MTGTIYPSVFFEFTFISVSFNYFIYIFSLLFIISASSQYKFFLSRLFFTIAKISGLLSVYIYVSIYLLRILSLSVYFLFKRFLTNTMGFSGGSDSKETACSVGDLGLIPG